jgi:AcrR family transcriptional regulator
MAVQDAADPAKTNRDRIIDAFMTLLAEARFEEIGFAQIARRAGLGLTECRAEFGSTLAVLAAHVKQVDRNVLAGAEAEMAEEPPRERLFDVLMRRLELLAPHKAAMRSLMRSAGRNPPLALALNAIAVRSQQWMLTAADIDAAGPKGMVRAQGLALLYASVLRTWLNDEDPGLAPTMAALDRALGRGARWAGMLDNLGHLPRWPGGGDRAGARRRTTDADDGPVVA